jgi:hypothetical protein
MDNDFDLTTMFDNPLYLEPCAELTLMDAALALETELRNDWRAGEGTPEDLRAEAIQSCQVVRDVANRVRMARWTREGRY